MYSAINHHKVPPSVRISEDVLTANVFDFARYHEPREFLLPFLAAASRQDGFSIVEQFPELYEVDVAEYEYWPYWQEPGCKPCEPDLVLRLYPKNEDPIALLIEAKFQSGISSFEDAADVKREAKAASQQLAKESWNLISWAQRHGIKKAALIYLTANYAPNWKDIKAGKDKGAPEVGFFHLHWGAALPVLVKLQHPMSEDLAVILEDNGFRQFEGIPLPEAGAFAGTPFHFSVEFAWPKATRKWVPYGIEGLK